MTIIRTGNTFRLFDSSVQTFEDLPIGTYRVRFSPLEGFSLQLTDDLNVGTEKIYGSHMRKVDKILGSYDRFDRSLGVLLSGDKGMGKSLMLRLLADGIQRKRGMPVVIVDSDADGIADFVDSLGECAVIFDEFEKVFPSRNDENNRQNQFLSMFDGMSSQRRMYILAINQVSNISSYMVNRPGRFHYHVRFDYPNPDQVREYLQDQAPGADSEQIEEAVRFSRKVSLNYDHLRAIAFELDTGDPFEEIIGDLNIKRDDYGIEYEVEVLLTDGNVIRRTARLDLFSKKSPAAHIALSGPYEAYVDFLLTDVALRDGALGVPAEKVKIAFYEDDDEMDLPEVESLTLCPVGQTDIGF